MYLAIKFNNSYSPNQHILAQFQFTMATFGILMGRYLGQQKMSVLSMALVFAAGRKGTWTGLFLDKEKT